MLRSSSETHRVLTSVRALFSFRDVDVFLFIQNLSKALYLGCPSSKKRIVYKYVSHTSFDVEEVQRFSNIVLSHYLHISHLVEISSCWLPLVVLVAGSYARNSLRCGKSLLRDRTTGSFLT